MAARLEPHRTSGVLYLPRAPCDLRLRVGDEGNDQQKPADKDVLVHTALDPSRWREETVEIAVPPK
jgi:hypothetical protein